MIRAALFDVDGTMYYQPPLRAVMACELGLRAYGGRAAGRRQTWRVLRAFRRVREDLRALGNPASPLEGLQYSETAERTGVDVTTVRAIVEEWMFTRPLRHLARFRRAGLTQAVDALRRAGVDVGVFSDYPTREKVEAFGLSSLISVQLCATDPEVNAFKPHPRGFLAASECWGHPPEEIVYIGDRIDVDAGGASAAGMPCVIVGRSRGESGVPFLPLRTLGVLPAALERLGRGRSRERTVGSGDVRCEWP